MIKNEFPVLPKYFILKIHFLSKFKVVIKNKLTSWR
jgi:hypothetical protein